MKAGKRSGVVVGAVCLAVAAAIGAPAAATAEAEPNNAIFDPEGPIVGGQTYSGIVSATDPNDWYVLYVDGTHQVHLTASATNTDSCMSVRLTNSDGKPIPPDYTTPTGVTQLFVRAERNEFGYGCATDLAYTFKLDPAAAIFPGPGKLPIKGTQEPNDSLGEAGGPLLPGAWYFTHLETFNDVDWLHFYVRPNGRRVDVKTVTYGGSACTSHSLALLDRTGAELPSTRTERGLIGHLYFTGRRGARLYVRALGRQQEGCVGTATVVQVTPEEAIMTAAEARSACARARKARRKWTRAVNADKRAIARAGDDVPRGLRRKLARDRRKLATARYQIRNYC
jgi:hypothetical protein